MAEPIQVDFSGKGGGKGGKGPAVIAPERAGLRILLSAAGSVITAFVAYYVMLPPLNFKAKEFYYYIGLVLLSFVVLLALLCRGGSRPEYMPFVKKTSRIPLLLTGVLVAFFAVAWVISSPFFQAKNYSAIMEVRTESNFEEEIQEPDYASIPRLDENSAKMVANRALGDLADVVSQFTIAESTTQINYQQKPVRVVTLAYANIIKWFTNTGEGLPGYVIVDMANEKTQLVKLEKRIRYSDEEHFGHLLKRHLRFQYPTAMFGEATFEIDDEGRPFWIAPVMDKVIGLLGGEDVIGIVLVDAVTGDCTRYTIEQLRGDESLQWIDRVFSATLLGTQYNFHGKYGGGFWNSLLGQSGVTVTTTGYNYLAKDDDVYMYTGITSITGDNSIVGFLLINQRTKEAIFYSVTGAAEESARGAAQAMVSDYGWSATFPLLINVSGQPTYFLSLKEASTEVVQGYAMVNVSQYNKIKVWGRNLAECIDNYVKALQDNGINAEDVQIDDAPSQGAPAPAAQETVTGAITDLRSAVIDGGTVYYIKLENHGQYFSVAAKDQPDVVLLSKGDTVTVTYQAGKNAILPAEKLEAAPKDAQQAKKAD